MRINKKLTLFYFLTLATAVITVAVIGLFAYFYRDFIMSGISLGIIGFIFLAIVYPFFSRLKETDKQLTDKNEEFRIIFNKSHDCIFGCNEEGRILAVNDRVEHALSYKPEEIIGTRLFSHFVELPESKNITDLLNENFEITLIKKDGSYMPGKLLMSRCGKRVTAFIEETTLLKEAERDILDITRQYKESEERYDLATQGSSVGIWDWDLVNDHFYASNVCYDMLGFRRGDLPEIFASFVGLLHPEDKERVVKAVTDHLKDHKVYDIEYRIRHKQGHYPWIHARGQAIWDNEGRAYRMAGSIDDINSKIESKKVLEQNESSLRHLYTVTTSPNLTLEEKINSLLHLCHQRFQMKFGAFGCCKDSRVVIQNVITADGSLLPGDTFNQSSSFLAPIMEELKAIQINDIRQTKWKDTPCIKKRNISSYLGVPIFVDGKPYGALCFFNSSEEKIELTKQQLTFLNIVGAWIGMEISRKRYQQTLKEEKIKADEANRAKTEFLQNMSHEIRIPMNGIMGMAYLLMDTDINDRQKKYANGVLSCSENLLSIIEDILDISRIETGKIGLYKSSFSLKELIFDTTKQTAAFAKKQDINFFLRYDPKAPEFFIEDQKRIGQIIGNLLTNALKFTSDGYIYVDVQMTNETNDEAAIKISIEDTGIGIPEDKQQVIFEKFQQVDSLSSKKYGGLGIGLSICKNLASFMNGELGLKSRPNVGSTFWLALPMKKDPEKPKEKIISHRMNGKTACLITDSEILSRIIAEQFEEFGIACLSTNNLQGLFNNLKAAKTFRPIDIVIIDELILDKESERNIKGIQSLKSFINTPFILIEHSFAEAPLHRQNKWSAILTKPFLADDLLEEADSLLYEQREEPKQVKLEDIPLVSKIKETPHILVVEDDPVSQQVIGEMLTKWDFRVSIAGNGKEAVGMAKSHRYNLILMDCVMPEMDGYEAAKTIRELEKDKGMQRTPIVALTARSERGEDQKCYDAGMDGYIKKPIRKPALQKALKKWIEKS